MVHKHFSHRSKYQREENDLRWESALFSYTSNLNWELFCPNCQSQTPSLIPSTQKVALGNVDMLSTLLSSFFSSTLKTRGWNTWPRLWENISPNPTQKLKLRIWYEQNLIYQYPKNNDWIEWSIFLYYQNQSVFPLVAGWQRSRCECDELFAGEKLCF